ncbi:MAG: hypothetical protein ISS31_08065, partial [Kiritimatiellae bacterium]|nr:hypothetical protein [Kiritimatiellia bacterium]
MRIQGSEDVTRFLTEDVEEITGGKFSFEEDPVEAAHLMMAHMDKKRAALKLRPLMFAKSFLAATEDTSAREVSEEELEAVAAAQAEGHYGGGHSCGGKKQIQG